MPEPTVTPEPKTTFQPATAPDSTPIPSKHVQFTARPMNIAVIPFLNVQPLIWDLKNHHHLFPVPPNEMGGLLKKGTMDVAIAPIVAKFLDPQLQIIPVGAIGSHGTVKSIRILSHVPLGGIQRLFVDQRSQTSVLMSRLMLKKWFGVKNLKIQQVEMASFHPNQTKPWEATLQFGDNALISPPTGMTVTDLGEEWFLRTQKPFIHAVWMTRDVVVAREIETDLTKAKEEGLKHLDEIVEHYPGIWVFDRPKAKEYLQKNIRYDYGPEEVKGHLEFERLLKEEGLIP